MKNLKRTINLLFTLLFVFISSLSYSQINFEDNDLDFLQKIAFSKYENIERFMNEKGYTLKTKHAYTSIYSLYFVHSRHEAITIIYSSSEKFKITTITVPLLDGLVAEAVLENNNFIKTNDPSGIQWKNSSYPFHFYIKETNDLQKIIYILSN